MHNQILKHFFSKEIEDIQNLSKAEDPQEFDPIRIKNFVNEINTPSMMRKMRDATPKELTHPDIVEAALSHEDPQIGQRYIERLQSPEVLDLASHSPLQVHP